MTDADHAHSHHEHELAAAAFIHALRSGDGDAMAALMPDLKSTRMLATALAYAVLNTTAFVAEDHGTTVDALLDQAQAALIEHVGACQGAG
jgi:hypothetical protein